jgi:hypothetical protein
LTYRFSKISEVIYTTFIQDMIGRGVEQPIRPPEEGTFKLPQRLKIKMAMGYEYKISDSQRQASEI